jgi:hypothetical protein
MGHPIAFLPSRYYNDFRAPRISTALLRTSSKYDPGADVRPVPEPDIAAVVTPRSPLVLRGAVEALAHCFQREMGSDAVQFDARDDNPDDYRAYLWAAYTDGLEALFSAPDKLSIVGAAVFRKRLPDAYGLQWIWLHPYHRRKSHLSTSWPYFVKRLKRFFVEPPLSAAMHGFVKKYPPPWPPYHFYRIVNTQRRAEAWKLLPRHPFPFSYGDGELIVKGVLRSHASYAAWMKALRVGGVIVEAPDGKLMKAKDVGDLEPSNPSLETEGRAA